MYRNFAQNNNNAATISTTTSTGIQRTKNVAILGKERQNTFFDNNKNTKNKEKDNLSKDCYRPTYGAYIYNSLPRGPYLQYKIKDQQYTARKNLSEDNDNNEQKQHQLNQHQQHQYQHQHQKYPKNQQNRQPGVSMSISMSTSTARDSSTLPRANPNIPGELDCRTFCNSQDNAIKLPQNSRLDAQIAQNQDSRNRLGGPPESSGGGADCIHNQPDHWSYRAELPEKKKQRLAAPTAAVNKGYQTLPHRFKAGPERDAAKRKPLPDEPEIKSGQLSYLRAGPASGNDFLKQIQEKNSDMLARIAAAAAVHHFWAPPHHRQNPPTVVSLVSGATSSEDERRSKHPTNGRSFGDLNLNNSSSSAQVNFVTLADVIRSRSEGLSELEGWALLCQSVQALQDLFLADTPSTSRIIPLVRPSTVQITSRGRVVFSLISASQFNKLIDAISYFDITCQLSPEYVRSIGKKAIFTESDIEKMWIYSLGMTLREGIKSDHNSAASYTCNLNDNVGPDQNLFNLQLGGIDNVTRPMTIRPQIPAMVGRSNGYPDPPGQTQFIDLADNTLDRVITCMCEQNLQQRASLMYLLDLNPERAKLRRVPQQIESLNPTFDESKFNFNKAKRNEILLKVVWRKGVFTLIINQSPLTPYHCLICPRMAENLPQIFNKEALQFSVKFLASLEDERFRIGYNSPGALASVNHLHLHLLYLEQELFVDKLVISTFCRSQQQAKPFSHIVMDIFREVVSAPQKEKPLKAERNQYADEIKSETDSGRGSTHGDKDILSGVEQNVPRLTNLKVFNKNVACDADCDKYSRVERGIPGHPLVFRRHSKDFIQKNDYRRKTIDVNLFDLEKARQEMATNKLNEDFNFSKSTTFIDKIVAFGDNDLKTVEYPVEDLIPRKTVSVANLKVRRQESRKLEYLTKAYSEESFLMKAKGPEFIVKSSLPSREINICGDSKCQYIGVVNVLLLDGQTIHISCNTLSTTSGELFKVIVKSERYVENYFLGLCALIGGDFVFLPADLKVYKVAPQNWANKSNKLNGTRNIFFTLFLRIKFFLPTLRGISSLESRHMMYLQLRKSILEKHILCTEDDLIFLGGLALQAEVGDFKESMKYSEYFTISHYLPEGVYHRNKEMGKYLRNSHFCRQGIHPTEAEQNFIKYVQEMKEYGFHLYSGVWTRDDDRMIDVYVGISLAGLVVFERNHNHRTNAANNSKTSYQRKLFASFEWPEIENLCFSKHILCIAVRKTESLKAKDNNRIKYKLRMDGRKSYFAFSLASEHHQFYMKLRNSFISLKSLSDELNIPITSPCQADKRADGMEMYGIVPETPVGPISNGLPENIKKIDKQLKVSAAVRVRNLKKSMLNDNRLLKLKEKFLRRSKSTVGSSDVGGGESRKKFDTKEKEKNRDVNNFRIEQLGPSKEESQNKENECPRAYVNDVSPKVYSPNRNRVKMGTRVFSSQFLNKSYDNIYERSLGGHQFRTQSSVENGSLEDPVCDELDPTDGDLYIVSPLDDHSAKSASFSSLCGVNKLPELSQQRLEAYVIHSSIRSDRNSRFSNFSLPNETLSESLLEKFNNISCNNTVNDRLLTKLTIIKERFNTCHRDKRDVHGPERDSSKYSSCGRRTSSEVVSTAAVDPHSLYSRSNERHLKDGNGNGNGKDFGNIANRRHQPRGALWQLSRSQESIFIDNKFPMRNDIVNQASMENDLDGFTLGISIVQGSDNNVYVKDLVKDGPGERAGIQIGDQIIAVNGKSLLNLSYEQSLEILQNTGQVVHLIVSQIAKRIQNNKSSPPYHPGNSPRSPDLSPETGSRNAAKKVINSEKPPKPTTKGRSKSINVTRTTTNHHGYLEDIKLPSSDIFSGRCGDSEHLEVCSIPTPATRTSNSIRDHIHDNSQFTGEKFKSARIGNKATSHTLTPAKSLPDLPKVVAIIPKRTGEQKQPDTRKIPIPRALANSRKYLGPVRYPVTPIKTVLTPVKHHLSLLADSDDDQVFI